MARIGVQSEDLRAQSQNVMRGSADVTETLGRLTAEISALASTWQGAASEAFQSRWADWQSGAQQVQLAMDNMGRFLEQAAVSYETTEDDLRSAAGR